MSTLLYVTAGASLWLLLCLIVHADATSERRTWIDKLDKYHWRFRYDKNLFKGSEISFAIKCQSDAEVELNIVWSLSRFPCVSEYINVNSVFVKGYFEYNEYVTGANSWKDTRSITCTKGTPVFFNPDNNTELMVTDLLHSSRPAANAGTETKEVKTAENQPVVVRVRRALGDRTTIHPSPDAGSKEIGGIAFQLGHDGHYVLELGCHDANSDGGVLPDSFNAEIIVQMEWDNNYMSAVDSQVLMFYGIMGLVFVGFAIFWLGMLACNWSVLLKIHFWIGGVILISMLEKTVYFIEYNNINTTGQPTQGVSIMAELVSGVRRGFDRMLILMLHYYHGLAQFHGISNPRLLDRAIIFGVIYIVSTSIVGCISAINMNSVPRTTVFFVDSVLNFALFSTFIVDSVLILITIKIALSKPIRILRLSGKVGKLTGYRCGKTRIVTVGIIFYFVINAILLWFLLPYRYKDFVTGNCSSGSSKELWAGEAFEHLFSSVILLATIIFYIPTATNNKSASSLLLDGGENDMGVEAEAGLGDSEEKVEMGTTQMQSGNGSPPELDDTETFIEG